MKKRLTKIITCVCFLLFMTGFQKSFSQVVDSVALKIVKAHTQLISDYLTSNKKDFRFYSANSISFLTKLTGIASESDGNTLGQMDPTQRDYENWLNWIELYKSSLKYDKKKQVIIVHKEIDAPGW